MTDVYDALKAGRPWVLGVQGQIAALCGIGLCDPYLRSHISAPCAFRYVSGAFSGTIAAAGSDIVFAAQSITLFGNGLGDAGTAEGVWWTLTLNDTDLTAGGNPVDRGFYFVIAGLAASAMAPHQRSGSGIATDPKYYNAFLRADAGYSSQIQSAILNNVNVVVAFGNTGQTYRLGLLCLSPEWGGPAGDKVTTNGRTSLPGYYQPFMAALCIGSRDEVNKLLMTLSIAVPFTVANIGPIPTSITTSAGAALSSSGSVSAPVRVAVPGYIICVPDALMCGLPGGVAGGSLQGLAYGAR